MIRAFFCFLMALIVAPSFSLASTVVLQPVAVVTDGGVLCEEAFSCTSPTEMQPENMINQAYLDKTYVSGVTDFEAYIASGPTETNVLPGPADNIYASESNATPTIVFDLGAVYEVSALALWNRGPDSQGVEDFSLFGALLADLSDMVSLGSFTATASYSGSNTYAAAEVFQFSATLGRYFVMNVHSYYGFCCTSISEVAFAATSTAPPPAPIPLPAGGLLLLSAIGGLGFARRRRGGELIAI